jgi:hypothetical protein
MYSVKNVLGDLARRSSDEMRTELHRARLLSANIGSEGSEAGP